MIREQGEKKGVKEEKEKKDAHTQSNKLTWDRQELDKMDICLPARSRIKMGNIMLKPRIKDLQNITSMALIYTRLSPYAHPNYVIPGIFAVSITPSVYFICERDRGKISVLCLCSPIS